jgi:hypothetical protein
LYHIERKITELDNALFEDGAHILYVNGEFQDIGHPIGRLMHDFHCSKAKEILNPILAQEVVYLKEAEGGREKMCKILEDMREEAAQIARESAIVSAIQNMMSDLMLSAEQAMSVMRIPEEERSRYLKKVSGC